MSVEARSLAAKSCTPVVAVFRPLKPRKVAAHQSQTPEWSVTTHAV